MKKWLKDKTDIIKTIICILLLIIFWSFIAYAVISTSNLSKTTTVVVNINETAIEPNFTDVVAQSVKSVVHVKCPQWQGSGFVIDKHIICTARHVVEGVEDFEITFSCGNKTHATRAISDKEHDVGFIWIEEELPDWMIAKIGSIKNCKLGQNIFIIGSPYGDINFNSVTKGIISGLNRNWEMTDPYTGDRYGWEVAFTSDSAAHPGNSGGAVFTMDGIVRGILVGGYSPVLNCSMPCDLFMKDIEQIYLMFVMDKYQLEKEKIFREQIHFLEQQIDFLKSLINDLDSTNKELIKRIEALEEQIQILEDCLILEHTEE